MLLANLELGLLGGNRGKGLHKYYCSFEEGIGDTRLVISITINSRGGEAHGGRPVDESDNSDVNVSLRCFDSHRQQIAAV